MRAGPSKTAIPILDTVRWRGQELVRPALERMQCSQRGRKADSAVALQDLLAARELDAFDARADLAEVIVLAELQGVVISWFLRRVARDITELHGRKRPTSREPPTIRGGGAATRIERACQSGDGVEVEQIGESRELADDGQLV